MCVFVALNVQPVSVAPSCLNVGVPQTSGNTKIGVPAGIVTDVGFDVTSLGETNEIERVSGSDVMFEFMNQTVRPNKKEYMVFFMEILDKILSDVPVFKMKCNISEEAVETSYNAMKRS